MVEIRAGSPAELATLRRAWAREWPGYGDRATGPDEDPGFEQRLADWWAGGAGGRKTWVAVEAGVPIGMVSLTVFERMPWPGQPASHWGYLSAAYVLADRRGRGIGTALLDALLDHARAERFARVVLSPSERAVPFYRRAGFDPATSLLLHPMTPHPVTP